MLSATEKVPCGPSPGPAAAAWQMGDKKGGHSLEMHWLLLPRAPALTPFLRQQARWEFRRRDGALPSRQPVPQRSGRPSTILQR